MATAIHVNGAAVIKVGNQGPASVDALNVIGYTENGPLINIEYHKEGVVADNAGPSIPADVQEMGKSAKITFALPIYDIALLGTWILGDQAGATEGSLPALGTLHFANANGFRLVISSPIDTQPWRFFFCSVDYARLRPGTKYNIYDIGIDAIAYVGVSTPADTKLYDHTDA